MHCLSWSRSVLRAADRYAYTGCGSTAYCYLFYLGSANTYTHRKILSVENLSRTNSWSLSLVKHLPDILQVLTAPGVAGALAPALTLALTLASALSNVRVASGKSSTSDCGTTPLCGGSRGGDESTRFIAPDCRGVDGRGRLVLD